MSRSARRVLMPVSSALWGGGQAVALRLAQALAGRGHAVTLCAGAGGAFEQRVRAQGLAFVPIALGGPGALVGLARLAALLRRERFDVVHTHLTRAALWGGLGARFLSVPVVAHAHGIDAPRFYRFAHRVLAVSDAVARHLCSGRDARIAVCKTALERPASDAARAAELRAGLAGGRPLLLIAAALHPNKGQGVAIEALADLPDAVLALAGDGPDRRRLERRVRALELDTRVHFLSFRADVPDLMAAADAVLVPSFREGYSLAAAEALMLGTPVVGTRGGGLVEVCGSEALLFEPGNVGDLASRVRAVLAQGPSARAAARARGEALIAQNALDPWIESVESTYRLLSAPAAN